PRALPRAQPARGLLEPQRAALADPGQSAPRPHPARRVRARVPRSAHVGRPGGRLPGVGREADRHGDPHDVHRGRDGVFGPRAATAWWFPAQVAAAEIDHFRHISRLPNDLGVDASELMYIEKSRRDLEAFRQAMPTWADVAAFGFLIDRVGQYQLEEFVGGSYLPLDRALPRILQEEKTHVGYGHVKLRDMVRTEEGRAEAQAAIDRWYPRGLDLCGRANSRRAARYQHWGLTHPT